MRAYALVFLLPPSEEREVRTSASSRGISVNEHFAEFAATRWRAIKLPKDYDNLHLGERPAYIELPEKYLRAFGVEAEEIQCMEEVVPPILREDVPAPEAGSSAADVGGDFGAANVRVVPGDALSAARFAESHLRSLCKERGSGAASHTY